MASATHSYAYLFAPQAGTTVVVTLMSGAFSADVPAQPPTPLPSVTVVPGTTITIYNDSAYAEGYVTISGGTGSGAWSAECHLNFLLGNADQPWALDTKGQYPNDDATIIGAFSSATPDNIPVVQPSGAQPSGIDSLYQVLDPAMVFLVDVAKSGNMLFRGNVPFTAPTVANGLQQVDFAGLHAAMQAKYQAQTGKTDFPAQGDYVLCDICLQSQASEGGSILWELQSFGGSDIATDLAGRAWYPPTPAAPLEAQMCNWQIEPHATPGNDVFDQHSAQDLAKLMAATHAKPRIYYIHCASGHDRTGIVASSYLIAGRGLGLEQALIQGTTVAKLPAGLGGQQLIVDCQDLDGANKGQTDPDRSRVLMIAPVYNTTVFNIYNAINSSSPVTAIPADATSADPAYVYSTYPWSS
ncbi:hypothetical protein [Chitinimonas koreensis]|uniref:hypothetical protein n=1 Tax=Chitinimonas koreensis TaxID=356302 RepID=UPI0003FA1F32|nr:hypothetical protein [Chitinimonas koreensis]QNM96431.1 hypothetical protein H9L41_22035 [Chitinimonas koreensis]